jgi:hypothetical protein
LAFAEYELFGTAKRDGLIAQKWTLCDWRRLARDRLGKAMTVRNFEISRNGSSQWNGSWLRWINDYRARRLLRKARKMMAKAARLAPWLGPDQ